MLPRVTSALTTAVGKASVRSANLCTITMLMSDASVLRCSRSWAVFSMTLTFPPIMAILVKGKVREIGTVDEVRRWGLHDERFTLEIESETSPLEGPFRVLLDEIVEGQRRVTVSLDNGAGFEDMMRSLLAAGVGLHSCARDEPDLEGAFSRILESERNPR